MLNRYLLPVNRHKHIDRRLTPCSSVIPESSKHRAVFSDQRALGHSDASFARLAIKLQLFALVSGDERGYLLAQWYYAALVWAAT